MDSYELALSWHGFTRTSLDDAFDLADGQIQLGYGNGDPRDLTSQQRAEISNYVTYTKIEEV